MASLQSLAEAFEAEERAAELKRRAARQAIERNGAAPEPDKRVRVRVLKLGHDKVSMGQHVAGVGEAFYEQGEHFEVDEAIARALEDRGFVEVTGEAPPEIPQKADRPEKGARGA